MSFRRRPALTAKEFWILVGIGAATLVIANTLVGADMLFSRTVGGGGSFFAAWCGARAVLWQQASPYLAPVVQLTQQLTYGRPALAGDNPHILTIPFFLLPLYFPFALTSNPTIARGVWIALSQAALIGTAFMTFHLADWRPPRPLVFAYAAFAVLGLYSVLAWYDGSPAVLLGLLYVGVVWAYGSGRDELAGALFALCLFDWEVGAPFVLLFLLRVFGERRWNVLAGSLMVIILLGAISFMLSPGWIMEFLTATLASVRAPFGFTTAAALESLFPMSGVLVSRILAGLILIALVYEWVTTRGSDFPRFLWTACLALATAPLLGFRTELGALVVLLPAVGVICAGTMQRRLQTPWIAGAFLAVSFGLPWLIFGRWLTAGDPKAGGLLLVFYPLLTILGLYWTRWWFTHPQQTWVERARETRTRA